jgi:hypothetical protein
MVYVSLQVGPYSYLRAYFPYNNINLTPNIIFPLGFKVTFQSTHLALKNLYCIEITNIPLALCTTHIKHVYFTLEFSIYIPYYLDVTIDCFYNSITDPGIYRDFGRNRPKTVAWLHDMMHDWSEQEEKMWEQFPRSNDCSLRRSNDNRIDKSQRDYSGLSRKCKPDDLIAAVDHPSRGKKTMTQEEFEKLLQQKCPWHPGANHAAIDCYHLRRIFSNPGGGKKNKPADKEPKDNDQGDKSHNAKFQDVSKTVNVIFG